MFATELPAELVILILSYLPLSSVAALSRLNRKWYNFIQQNDMNRETIYRDAAFYEGYVPRPTILLQDLARDDYGPSLRGALYSKRAMVGVKGWKEFCRKRRMIERAWAGRAPSVVVPSPRPPGPHGSGQTEPKPESMHYRRVHRIKVDEKAGIVMATTQLGGLVVRDLETDAVLWELPAWYVRGYAHLEYGEGYMIFDREDGNKEVWRRTADIPVLASSSSMDTSPDNASPTTTPSPSLQPEVDQLSLPDERQRHVMNYISHLTSQSHPSSSSAATATPSDEPPNAKAKFIPHAVLHMPERTRAYRFVYPHLLVAGLERAFVWDVRIGKIVETVEGIQVVQPNSGQVHEDDQQEDDRGEGSSKVNDVPSGSGQPQEQGIGTLDPDLAVLADFLPPPSHIASSTGAPYYEPQTSNAQLDDEPEESEDHDYSEGHEHEPGIDDEDDEDDEVQGNTNAQPQFLGLVRYVDLSPRHLFFAGRYLLRVFSRATGKCVLDIPSTKWRYGRWRWEVASRRSNVGMGVGQSVGCDGDVERDDYARAKEEGREAVRMPVRCSLEEYSTATRRKMVIDQFIAVHVSADGKHLVAMLSGSRLVIMHHFEALLVKRPPGQRSGAKHALESTASTHEAGSSSTSASNPSSAIVATSTALIQSSTPQDIRRVQKAKSRDAGRKREQYEKDKEIFMNTLDVQLGPPMASASIYLAYENGRIGVVTTNAVYVVIPTIPSSPPSPPWLSTIKNSRAQSTTRAQNHKVASTLTSRLSKPTPTPPPLSILRLPYFSNPSWLNEVSCLMMSDTGLYLNWNPTWPRLGDDLGAGGGAGAVVVGAGAWFGLGGGGTVVAGGHGQGAAGAGAGGVAGALEDGGGSVASLGMEALDREEEEERERMMEEWEAEYELDLERYERYEDERYHVSQNGDMFVVPAARELEESEISTIYRVDFAPVQQS